MVLPRILFILIGYKLVITNDDKVSADYNAAKRSIKNNKKI